jgi:hypothetical protein
VTGWLGSPKKSSPLFPAAASAFFLRTGIECASASGLRARQKPTFAQSNYNQRRQDRAHRRFLSAVKTLATVRRLAFPTLAAVNVTGTVETREAKPALESRPWRLPVRTSN